MNDVLAGFGLSEDVIVVITIYAVIIVAAFWLAMIIWAYRDMRARSRDTLGQLGVALMVALLNVPGRWGTTDVFGRGGIREEPKTRLRPQLSDGNQ